MNTDLVTGSLDVSGHTLQAVLEESASPDKVPDESATTRIFAIQAAQCAYKRSLASTLIERMYATRGYQSSALSSVEPLNQKTFLVSERSVPLGTLTVGIDSPKGLLADSLFPDEVHSIRAEGFGVCEVTKLAIDRRARSRRLLPSLFHVAYIYARCVKKMHRLLIEVNPRHVSYYETMLGFQVIGPERPNTRVDAPAVLLALDLVHAEKQISNLGGKPQLAATRRSAYPQCFPTKDEAAILGRLHRAEEHVAHVPESLMGASPVRRAARHAAMKH